MKIDSSKPSKQQSKTAQEIKKEYESGERDFHNLDLRGESFAESNLSGANFTDCNGNDSVVVVSYINTMNDGSKRQEYLNKRKL